MFIYSVFNWVLGFPASLFYEFLSGGILALLAENHYAQK